MAINYNIKAQVVDIRHDVPKANDTFLVDTNVWYWMSYTRASISARTYQIRDYPDYLKQARIQKSTLTYCGLSLNELAHNIEGTEKKLFDPGNIFPPKEFRHNRPSERAKVVNEIRIAWNTVESIGALIPITIDQTVIDASLINLDTLSLDGYDIFILEAMKLSGINSILTDDGDFSTVQGITLFTANNSVITAAKTQNKLFTRK